MVPQGRQTVAIIRMNAACVYFVGVLGFALLE